MKLHRILIIFMCCSSAFSIRTFGQRQVTTKLVTIAEGFAETSVNAVIFRRNSISSFNGHQYVAYYDNSSHVVLAKRKLGSEEWEINQTQFNGNVKDAHNSISIIHDGDGYLHMSWDHHNDPLRYSVSLEPESINMGKKRAMVGKTEKKVTYPEFYRLKNGDLIFLFRDGSSGNGNLLMNHYDVKTKTWTRRQNNLIDGEGERNAYWQMCVDQLGTMHLSWVWRETGDVATNHDMCYARSKDEGKSWEMSTGEAYNFPINEKNAEYLMRIPQKSNLTNTTSIAADRKGNPYISTYFKSDADQATQFKLLYRLNGEWRSTTVSERKSDFTLGGTGTRSIPISRPQVLIQQKEDEQHIHMIYRDEEYDNKICLASARISEMLSWKIQTINRYSMNRWEPSYDTELWESKQLLHIYHQVVYQGDADADLKREPTQVGVLEVFLD